METLENLKDQFWSEKVWLPKNVTWKDFVNQDDGVFHPQSYNLYTAFIIALVLFITDPLFERYIARNIGLLFIKESRYVVSTHNKVLESVYRRNRRPNYQIIEGLTKQTDFTQRQIERWFRKRRNHDKGNLLTKFTEGCWRLLIHSLLLATGIVVVKDASWIWDSEEFWRNYPHHHVSNGVYWYYMLQLGNSISAMARHCLYDNRKDFWIFLIHHVAAILLLILSWCSNFVRIGTAVLVIHDLSDPFLHLMKLCIYLKRERMVDITVTIFAASWIITRLCIFPYKCIIPTLFCARLHSYVLWGFYISLFITLFILHCIWTKFLIAGFLNHFVNQSLKDTRSSDEEESSDEDEPVMNGHIKTKGL